VRGEKRMCRSGLEVFWNLGGIYIRKADERLRCNGCKSKSGQFGVSGIVGDGSDSNGSIEFIGLEIDSGDDFAE
jgi:hypothetical protein